MQRIKNEETENELVRYKLLWVEVVFADSASWPYPSYAEAMHQNEDALSSHRLSSFSSHSLKQH